MLLVTLNHITFKYNQGEQKFQVRERKLLSTLCVIPTDMIQNNLVASIVFVLFDAICLLQLTRRYVSIRYAN